MMQQLFEELFEVAKERSTRKSRNGICRYLAEAFTDKYNSYFNKERFIRYYKKFVESKSISNNPNGEFPDQCAQFLGYENYEDYVLKNSSRKESDEDDEKIPIPIHIDSENDDSIKKKNKKSSSNQSSFQKNKNSQPTHFFGLSGKYQKITIINITIILILAIVLATDAFSKNKERWMTWKTNEYVEAEFTAGKYYSGQLEPYDQKMLETFKKVEDPDCDTRYFNTNGQPILWYYKVGKGHLELYTAPGLHPINGKTLKVITRYMIQTHICPNY
jgi:hypothetical protein